MANAYVDLGTWWCVTPFIGAGIGTSYNRISGFRDDGLSNNFGVPRPSSVTYAADSGKWNFAWALHAGLAYRVTPDVTLELGYSYMNLGDATTGFNSNFGGGADPAMPVDHERHHFERLHARRALEPRQPAGLRAAAGHQGLIAI